MTDPLVPLARTNLQLRPAGALDPRKTAVVVVDMVNHQVTRGRGYMADLERDGVDVDYIVGRVQSSVVPNLQRLLHACREAGGTVAHVRLGAYRNDFADGAPALRRSLKAWDAREGAWACEVIEPLKTQPGDISLIKTSSGGFNSSALDSHLRNAGIENVLYTGVITNGCVLLTAAAGYDLGYKGFLVTDATATLTPQLQAASEEIIAMYIAKPVTTQDALSMLAGADGDGR